MSNNTNNTTKTDGRIFVMPENPPTFIWDSSVEMIRSFSTGQGKLAQELQNPIYQEFVSLPVPVQIALGFAYLAKNPEQLEFIRLGAFCKSHYRALLGDTDNVGEPEVTSSVQYKERVERLQQLRYEAALRAIEREPALQSAIDLKKLEKSIKTWTEVETSTYQTMKAGEEKLRESFGKLLDFGVPVETKETGIFSLKVSGEDNADDVRQILKSKDKFLRLSSTEALGVSEFRFKLV